jgi:hypothetical protein
MCPMCAMTAAWIAVSIATTGGLTAVALKRAVTLKSASNPQPTNLSKEDHHG